jgi:hypothetical protein
MIIAAKDSNIYVIYLRLNNSWIKTVGTDKM